MDTTDTTVAGSAAGDTTTAQPAPTAPSARQGSKRGIAVQIMKDNADKPMHEVLKLIAEANAYTLGDARSYYVWIVKNGYAPGVIEERQKKARDPAKAGKKSPTLADISALKTPEEIETARVETANKISAIQDKLKNKRSGNKGGSDDTKTEGVQVSL